MPVATAGDCRLPGEPRSPRARQLLQKLWLDRCPTSKYGPPPPKGVGDPFVIENRSSSVLSFAEDDVEAASIGSGCGPLRPLKDPGSPVNLPLPPRPPLSRESSFQSNVEPPSLKSNSGAGRYIEKNPLLSLHVSLECSGGDSPDNPLPLDLIQSSVTLDDASSDTGDSTVGGAAHPGGSISATGASSTFGEPSDTTTRNLHRSFCSCKRGAKPAWKSYDEAFQKSSGGPGGLSLGASGALDSRVGESNRTTCWCWSSKLVFYTVYLCAVFLVVFFTEAARMEMVPITVFLIVLSLALFLFILFCVCFIIFI